MSKSMRALLILLLLSCTATATADAAAESTWPDGTSSEWNGYPAHDFKLPGDGANCIVVSPKKAAEGRPWIWRARFWGHQPALDLLLLEKGFHLTYCDVAGLFGAPAAVKRWDAFHALADQERVLLPARPRGHVAGRTHHRQLGVPQSGQGRRDLRRQPGLRLQFLARRKERQVLEGRLGSLPECLRDHRRIRRRLPPTAQPRNPRTTRQAEGAHRPRARPRPTKSSRWPGTARPSRGTTKSWAGPVRVWRKPGKGHHPHGLHPPDELAAFLLEAVRDRR